MAFDALSPGFADPVFEAQATFRSVMTALSEPGRIVALRGVAGAPAALGPVMGAVALTLFDHDTPVWRDAALARPEVDDWIRFHTGAPIVEEPARAAFALVGEVAALPDYDAFALGTDAEPSRSATLIVAVAGFGRGADWRLAGPGIETTRDLAVAGGPPDLDGRGAANRAIFPRGVDLLLAGPAALAGLPRTTRIERA